MALELEHSPLASPTSQPSPPSSPERSLSNLLRSRSLRKREGTSPSNASINSNDQGGLRGSIDRGLDKVLSKTKSNASDSTERRGSKEGRKLSKLVPRRRRRKKNGEATDGDAEDVDRGSASALGIDSSKLNISDTNLSEGSVGENKSGGSSLFTDDSEPEPSSRPALVSRNSHKGYLTLSSPLITAESIDPAEQDDGEAAGRLVSPPPVPPLPTQVSKTSSVPSLDKLPSSLQSDVKEPDSLAAQDKEQELSKSFPTTRSNRSASLAKSGLSLITKRPETPNNTFDPTTSTQTPPNKVETPSTLVTPPTPVLPQDGSPRLKGFGRDVLKSENSAERSSPAAPRHNGESIAHRRTRSAVSASSKLGTNLARPLSPTIEETKTPGGSLIQPSGSSGFFSSMISATQTAVNSISNTFSSSAGASQRARSATSSSAPENTGSVGDEEVILTNSDPLATNETEQEPAIATMGTGNLSLTHLGIAEQPKPQFTEDVIRSPIDDARSIRTEEISAAEAISAAYASSPANEKVATQGDNMSISGRPRSIGSNVGSQQGNGTPPRSLLNGVEGGRLARSGSVRSKLSGRRRRTRGSSATTGGGGAIAAALSASHAALAHPTTGNHRPTGFAVASSKRNREFHQLFKSVPEDDYLIEDYSAALQRDILLQGRLYVSERHICFSSNILGWVTNLVMSYDEVIAMEKKSTAVIFPNAIVIQTLHARNVFASFLSRDTTYDLLIEIWRIGHPNLKQSPNGHVLDEAGEANEKADHDESTDTESGDSSEDYYDEDAEDHDLAGSIGDGGTSAPASEAGDAVKAGARKASGTGSAINGSATKNASDPSGGTGTTVAGAHGPATHGPTECADQDSHFEKLLIDTTIPAPLGKVYSMMFGPESGDVMRRFLVDDQKSTELQLEDDQKGMGEDVKSFSYSYIKPLYASIGPKQTKCLVNQTLDFFDLERAVTVTCSTQTPDVPSGNAFVTKTKYCLMWGPSNSTRMIMTYTIEWSAKSWLKTPIEKGANEGQSQYGKDLAAFFQQQVAAKSPTKGPKGKSKGKKKKAAIEGTTDDGVDAKAAKAKSSDSKTKSWGLFQPLHGVLSPITDLLGPVGVMGVLLVIVTMLWLRQSYRQGASASSGHLMYNTAERVAAYEELWRREESDLWDWLDDRMRLHDLANSEHGARRAKIYSSSNIAANLKDERMEERQMDDAIKVTKRRLEELEDAVKRKRERAA